MADFNRAILDALNGLREDFRENRDETREKLDAIAEKQERHQEYIIDQKAKISMFKWVAAVGGLSGVSSFFKSFLN